MIESENRFVLTRARATVKNWLGGKDPRRRDPMLVVVQLYYIKIEGNATTFIAISAIPTGDEKNLQHNETQEMKT